jgi:rhodanese-related sulfurtransferase
MDHSSGFLKLVSERRPYVKELTVEQAREHLSQNPKAVLLDVREDHEWDRDHAEGAVHLGKGVLERDLEKQFPDSDQEIIMYCGGGYRSVLTASVAQEMGYRNVYSMIGGYKALAQAKWPLKKGE